MTPSRTRQSHASSFAERLKLAQAAKGLTNEDFARAVGVSLRLLQKYRAGTVQPSGATLARICAEVEQPVEWFYAEAAA